MSKYKYNLRAIFANAKIVVNKDEDGKKRGDTKGSSGMSQKLRSAISTADGLKKRGDYKGAASAYRKAARIAQQEGNAAARSRMIRQAEDCEKKANPKK